MSEKKNKIYNLALKKDQYSQQIPSPGNILVQCLSKKQNPDLSCDIGKKQLLFNIFQQSNILKGKQQWKHPRPFEILCKKQALAYKSRIKKVKNIALAGLLRLKISDSVLLSSKQTNVPDLFGNNYLSKEQLKQFYNTIKSEGKKDFQEISLKTKMANSTERRIHQNPAEISTRLHRYKSSWKLNNILSSRTHTSCLLRQISLEKGFKKTSAITPTISLAKQNSLQSHRKKIEQLEKLTLKQQKENIHPNSWTKNLRNPQPIEREIQMKIVQSINRDGFKVRGSNKLEKQYNWLIQKKNSVFQSIENKRKYYIENSHNGKNQTDSSSNENPQVQNVSYGRQQ